MKFNWGTAIVLAMLAFVGFIMYFFVITLVDKTYDHELVTEKYYEKELEFQENIEKERATIADSMQVEIKHSKGTGIDLIFPDKTKDKMVVGLVKLYRPSQESKDFVVPITGLNGQSIHIPDEKLLQGRWDISVEYSVNDKDYSSNFKIKYLKIEN
ncbi:MAG: FixH family protein [Capnocytophaga sp.]|nr:FixH family protein [Capnocytophaga sp.]